MGKNGHWYNDIHMCVSNYCSRKWDRTSITIIPVNNLFVKLVKISEKR